MPDTQPEFPAATSAALALCRLVSVLLGLWLIATSLFFLVRFTAVFYADNQGAIDQLLGR
ncbi:MAG: hypothetical protein GC168_04365 [Candidatus Hydrogenedens sp.]|nr:hypothetical protein [Candidatus Hydrogenedens sp.]